LYAVTNHFGSLNFGHYTAVCKNFRNGKWWDYNDSSVTELKEDEVVSNAAYVLYYKRRNFYPDNDINYSQIRIAPSDQSNGDLTIITSTIDTI